MNIEKMKILYDAVQYGSLKKAAEELNYTQSGLLYAINSVEKEEGITLLTRTHKGVELTKEGAVLEPYVLKLIEDMQLFNEKKAELLNEQSATLKIGAYPTIANQWMPEVIRRMRYRSNDHFEVVTGTKDLSAWVNEGKIDVAVVESSISEGHNWLSLADDEVCVAVPANEPFDEENRIGLNQLEHFNVIMPEYNASSFGTDIIRDWMESRDSEQNISASTSNGALLLRLVGKGLGITFLSSLYKNECPDTVKMLHLDPPIRREIGIITKRGTRMTKLMERFVNELEHYLEEEVL